ncbi:MULTISPECIES: FHA domain-containing protein FhaB/FipA [Trueperella]|uniref:PSer/pThr/pTyr-binding forkhead associated (FHA) protein n=1 Tax=Trueperella abortisuis TaxID=445930 RepID=A0ABT9PFC2_9ACTO|nr:MULTISPECIES: FHA domain-containing protein [Trueperella]MDP9831397.1 pSer/pThr/pTyr-binding forkhead associated (FHA) protein [Trueperella abortisuis]MDY5403290.1 FHA domain-containing protein [Trueperella sp.]
MSALVVTLFRYGFLILLWLFVFAVVLTVKKDVYGTRVTSRTTGRPQAKVAARTTARPRRASTPTPRAAAQPHLVVSGGSLAGSTIPLSGSITVGRSPDSALVLDDGYTSARHARFYTDGHDWYVEDLNSTNGTWVGGTRIYEPTRLSFGTPVTIGKTTLEIRQ